MATIVNNQLDIVTIPNDFTIQHTQAPYTKATMEVSYSWSEGVLQIPIAAPPGDPSNPVPCEIVRAHAPCGQFVASWIAERDGQMPYLPDPYTANPNLRIASIQINSRAPKLASDGITRSFRVWGTYVFLLVRPIYVASVGAWMGWVPYDAVAPQLNVISPGQFRQVF